MAKYPFLTKFPAKFLLSETIWGCAPVFETRFSKNQVSNVKLDFWTIKL